MKTEFKWLADELSVLYECVQYATLKDGEYNIEWPASPLEPNKNDILAVVNLLTPAKEPEQIHCMLQDVKKVIVNEYCNLDWAFIQFHCYAHVIINKELPELNDELEEDCEFMESTASYVAALAMRRYFNIEFITSYMAETLAQLFYDRTLIESHKFVKWDSKKRSETTALIFGKLILKEKQFLQ